MKRLALLPLFMLLLAASPGSGGPGFSGSGGGVCIVVTPDPGGGGGGVPEEWMELGERATPYSAELQAPLASSALDILPADRRTTWNPGLPGGIPTTRTVFTTLTEAHLSLDGTGDNYQVINNALEGAADAYWYSGTIQEVVLPAGTIRTTQPISLRRSGVVLRGQGSTTRIRLDGQNYRNAIRISQNAFGSFHPTIQGPWRLAADAAKGDTSIALSNADAASIEVGDILVVDQEDDSFVWLGDAIYQKRQSIAVGCNDSHGPCLRQSDAWRSITSMVRVTGKTVGATTTALELQDPLHMPLTTALYAEAWMLATEWTVARPLNDGVHWAGVEDLYLTGGNLLINNAAFAWASGVEVDGWQGTANIGEYVAPGGFFGTALNVVHCYRCEIRGNYIHHTRNIAAGGDGYLLSLGSYTSETLVENNIVVFGNKPIVLNMAGGGNVIAYNYVDGARTWVEGWQEGAIDLNHQAFTHNALVEGNWSANITSDTTHGNAGWHAFFRNHAVGFNDEVIFGLYPHEGMIGQPDSGFRRAAGADGYHRESTWIGNVLGVHADGSEQYQIDNTTGILLGTATVWRMGMAPYGDGGAYDEGQAVANMYRHLNWDAVSGAIADTDAGNTAELPPSLYLSAAPPEFLGYTWPPFDPAGATSGDRITSIPARERYLALEGADGWTGHLDGTSGDPAFGGTAATSNVAPSAVSTIHQTHGVNGSSASASVTFPSAPGVGGRLFVALQFGAGASQVNAPSTVPTGWTLANSTAAWGGIGTYLYSKVADGTETGLAVTLGGVTDWHMLFWEDGAAGAYVTSLADNCDGAAPVSPELAVTTGQRIVAMHTAAVYGATFTPGVNWELVGYSNPSFTRIIVQAGIATGTPVASLVANEGGGWSGCLIAAYETQADVGPGSGGGTGGSGGSGGTGGAGGAGGSGGTGGTGGSAIIPSPALLLATAASGSGTWGDPVTNVYAEDGNHLRTNPGDAGSTVTVSGFDYTAIPSGAAIASVEYAARFWSSSGPVNITPIHASVPGSTVLWDPDLPVGGFNNVFTTLPAPGGGWTREAVQNLSWRLEKVNTADFVGIDWLGVRVTYTGP